MKKSNRELCIEMWGIIAEGALTEKHKALDIMQFGNYPRHECFACEDARADCRKCAVKWYDNQPTPITDDECQCADDDSPYYKWCNAKTKEERTKYAIQILERITQTWEEPTNE